MNGRWSRCARGFVAGLAVVLCAAARAEAPSLEWVHVVQGIRTAPLAEVRSHAQVDALSVNWFGTVYAAGTFHGAVTFASNQDPILFTSPHWSQHQVGGQAQMFVCSLATSGEVISLFALPCEGGSAATAVASGPDGSVFASGNFRGPIPDLPGTPQPVESGAATWNERGVVVKLGFDGTPQWYRTFPAAHESKAIAISVMDDTVYAAGTFVGEFGADPVDRARSVRERRGIFLRAWDMDGNEKWTHTISSGRHHALGSMAVDSHGGIYITGRNIGALNFDPEGAQYVLRRTGGFVAKYSACGALEWARSIGEQAEGKSIAASSASGVFVAGRMWHGPIAFETTLAPFVLEGAGQSDIFMLHLTSTGEFRWVRRIGGKDDDVSGGIAVDSHGNAYIQGVVQGKATTERGPEVNDFETWVDFISKVNPDGDIVWTHTREKSSLSFSPHTLAIDRRGGVYAAGMVMSPGVDLDPNGLSSIVTSDNENFTFVAKYAPPRPDAALLQGRYADPQEDAIDPLIDGSKD